MKKLIVDRLDYSILRERHKMLPIYTLMTTIDERIGSSGLRKVSGAIFHGIQIDFRD